MPKLNRIPAGARADAPVDKLARDVVKQRVRAAIHYWERAAKRGSPRVDDIHQLRVWSRRAKAALQLFASRLPEESTAEVMRILKKVRKRAGQARDCDVLLDTLDKRSRNVLTEALEQLEEQRQECAKRLRRSYRKNVKSGELLNLLQSLEKKSQLSSHNGKAAPPLPFGPWFQQQFVGITADLRRQLRISRPGERRIHPLRIAGKQVRYALEIGLPALSKLTGRQLYEALEQLQEHLGDICDHQTLAEQYRDLAQDLKPKQRTYLIEAADKHLQQAHAGWTKFIRWWTGAGGRNKLLRLLNAVQPLKKTQRQGGRQTQRRNSHEK
jgi:CHAD domain-containing protein